MSTLKIKNVHKSFGDTHILKGINLDIKDGEFIILVGPSGCGKSTLMNCIAGLEKVTGGNIEIEGNDVVNVSPKNRDIAMVFQSYALYPTMTVAQNIGFALEIRKIPKQEREAEIQRVAQLLKMEHLLDRKPAALSGGQRQRVAMGRALARKPKIYLFDEPLSNLDAKLRIEMRTEIKKLHQHLKTTSVYVTHDQIEAMTLADRIAVMEGGEVQQFGTPQEIYDNPVNMFVAGFMGAPSMNFIPCKIEEIDGEFFIPFATNGSQTSLQVINPPTDLRNYVGKELILGIRPEQITHVIPHQVDADHTATFEARIEVMEPTGPDTLIFIKANDCEVECRVNPKDAGQQGEVMTFMLDMEKAVFFDKDTQQRI